MDDKFRATIEDAVAQAFKDSEATQQHQLQQQRATEEQFNKLIS